MKVPSEYLDDLLKPDALKNKGARDELGRHLDSLRGDADDLLARLQSMNRLGQWTPQLWQNGAQLAITLDSAAYVSFGSLVFCHARFTVNAAGAVGLMEIRGLPFKALYTCIGGEMVVFTGGVNRIGATRMTAGTSTAVMTVDNNAADFGTAPAIALAVGNGIRMSAVFLRQP